MLQEPWGESRDFDMAGEGRMVLGTEGSFLSRDTGALPAAPQKHHCQLRNHPSGASSEDAWLLLSSAQAPELLLSLHSAAA